MILSCPSCRARYVVPDSTIGAGGRKVRCVKCRFSWHQEGLEASLAPGERSEAPRAATPAASPPAPGPEPVPQYEPEPDPDRDEVPAAEDWVGEQDDVIEEEAAPPRQRRARLWSILAVVLALLIVGAAATIYFLGWPEIGQRIGFATDPAQRLAISGNVSREQLPTNTELLTVTGEIRNLTDEVQRLPQIRADLLDGAGATVYSWSIAPPRAQLQPRETISFNSATTDVPSGGRNLSLTFAPLT